MSQAPPPPQPQQPYQPPAQYPPPPPPSGGASTGLILGIVGCTGAVVLVIILMLAVAILLPALGAARRTARRMQNSTQLRGIHQGLVTYGNSNKEWFVGVDSDGQVILDDIATTGGSGDGDTVEARYWILLNGSFFTPDYAISPSETDVRYDWAYSGPVTVDHYSYAMLQFDGTPGQVVADPQTPHRVHEWSQTLNTQAIVAGDRNTGTNATSAVDSIHSGSSGQWRGSVLWNDNHVAFEQTHILPTRYGSGPENNQDNLFEAVDDTDAYLIHTGDR